MILIIDRFSSSDFNKMQKKSLSEDQSAAEYVKVHFMCYEKLLYERGTYSALAIVNFRFL